MPAKKYYACSRKTTGVSDLFRIIASGKDPTRSSHPGYRYCTGPFRTKKKAKQYARRMETIRRG